MALLSWAAAGCAVTSPRPFIQMARALAVVATLAVACTWPTLTNSKADPAYSGTSSIRPVMSAESTSSREPRSGKTRARYPLADSASAYRYASRALSGKSNDPTVITARPKSAVGAEGRGPAGAVQAAQAITRTMPATRTALCCPSIRRSGSWIFRGDWRAGLVKDGVHHGHNMGQRELCGVIDAAHHIRIGGLKQAQAPVLRRRVDALHVADTPSSPVLPPDGLAQCPLHAGHLQR